MLKIEEDSNDLINVRSHNIVEAIFRDSKTIGAHFDFNMDTNSSGKSVAETIRQSFCLEEKGNNKRNISWGKTLDKFRWKEIMRFFRGCQNGCLVSLVL